MIKNSEENTKNLSYGEETKIKKLGEVATFEYGYTATAREQGKFRYIRITDIDEYGNISDKDKKYVDLLNETAEKKYLLKEGDIIMARIGSVGETGIFTGQEKSIFASYLIRINLNKEVILPKYYWYFTKTQEYWNQVKQLTKGTVQHLLKLTSIILFFHQLFREFSQNYYSLIGCFFLLFLFLI